MAQRTTSHPFNRYPILKAPSPPIYSTLNSKLPSPGSLLVCHFAFWSLSDFSYFRVKPKSLMRVSANAFSPSSSFIFHQALSSMPPWAPSMDIAHPTGCLDQAAPGLLWALASSVDHGGGRLGSPVGKCLGCSPEAGLCNGKARAFVFTHSFIHPFSHFLLSTRC